MNNDPLAQLKPLIEPAAISWWPPAPGWWVLGALLLLLIVLLVFYAWRRWRFHRNTAYQREALYLIQQLDSTQPAQQLQQVAEIMRRAAICVWGREYIGTADWEKILELSHSTYQKNSRKKNITRALDDDSKALLTQSLYNGSVPTLTAMQHFVMQVGNWLKTLPPVER
jgi:hypothetical protein